MTIPPTIPDTFIGRMGRALAQTAIALTGAYGLSIAGFLLLRALMGEAWWIMAAINSFIHLMYLPALALIPLCWLLRRPRLSLLLLPALAALLGYGPLFVPRAASAPPDTPRLRLLTYNLGGRIIDLDGMAAVIGAADADVVALQEVSETAADYLRAHMADAYPYQALHPVPGEPIPGQGVLSRYPILDDEFWRFYLSGQRVRLDYDPAPLTLYNVHTLPPLFARDGFTLRGHEVAYVLERAALDSPPVILIGDFNMTPESDDYRRVSAAYQDVWAAVGLGFGFTFPAGRLIPPLARIDYVFHDAHFSALAARVWDESGGSDHLPLLVTLAAAS